MPILARQITPLSFWKISDLEFRSRAVSPTVWLLSRTSHGESHVLMHNSDIKIIFSRYFTEYISWLHPNHPSYYAGILYGSVQLGPVLYLHLRLLSPSGPGYQHMTLSSIRLTSPCNDGCISNGHLISSSRLFIFLVVLSFRKLSSFTLAFIEYSSLGTLLFELSF